jgi:hypothetical protein
MLSRTMKAISRSLDRETSAARTLSPFHCVVVYEDLAASERGESFYRQLAATLEDSCKLTHHLWSFPVLAIPEMRNMAASAAATADVVILALSGKKRLPAKVKEWIEMWLWLIDGAHPALVTLFEGENGEYKSIRDYLRAATASKRLEFFPQSASRTDAYSPARPTRKIGGTILPLPAWDCAENGSCATF